MFKVIGRQWRKNAIMAAVVDAVGIPRTNNIAGLITKENVAELFAFAESSEAKVWIAAA